MNQNIKNITFIVILVATLVAVLLITLKTDRDNPPIEGVDELLEFSIEQNTLEYNKCIDSGAEWIRFSNSCADFCDKNNSCPFTVTYSCNCENNQCWDNNKKKCVDL